MGDHLTIRQFFLKAQGYIILLRYSIFELSLRDTLLSETPCIFILLDSRKTQFIWHIRLGHKHVIWYSVSYEPIFIKPY